jgi:acetoin utilization deacetylase AcuC-like enzyme
MCPPDDAPGSFSKSPTKPRRLMEHLAREGQLHHFDVDDSWEPLEPDDFLVAHEQRYVDGFFAGEPALCRRNGLAWFPEFAQSVRYTNGSIVAALQACTANPAVVAFSPTSGFHHADPHGGSAFCTFSGQVIASVRLWREHKRRGAWLDLDGHFGNSIEDSRGFVPDLDEAVPPGWNVNPVGFGQRYLDDLAESLEGLREELLAGRLHYVAFAHGADSHEDDDLGGQLNTEQWLEASRMVYTMVRDTGHQLGHPVPLALALFGGYRRDDLDAVLRLHAADLRECRCILGGAPD